MDDEYPSTNSNFYDFFTNFSVILLFQNSSNCDWFANETFRPTFESVDRFKRNQLKKKKKFYSKKRAISINRISIVSTLKIHLKSNNSF